MSRHRCGASARSSSAFLAKRISSWGSPRARSKTQAPSARPTKPGAPLGSVTIRTAASRAGRGGGTPSGYEVTTHGGRQGTGLDAVAWAARGEELGVGEVLLNSMDADGTRAGYDLAMLREVRAAVSVPVVASGGAGSVEDFAPAVAAGADAVLAASVFHFGQLSIGQVKDALRAEGHPVR